ncbi:MAG: hydroxymethylglutaryl-CoA synthase [Bacteroidetes bacterium MED-G20]|nr:MAG: hydroxymethylglutaryl-CoA synthase [Bacteroidetes bacterium MED-G20]|tara:strand:- start:607 stop:1989 length:1383 start_codon:yes stop_codon:yes gene_type:complete
MEFGIDAIDYYLPRIALKISSLAEKRNIIPAKLEKGLGLQYMALTDCNEDTASMAANALLNLIKNNNVDPKTIGRIYLGTESALDAAKPTATYAVGAVEKIISSKFGDRCFKNCDVVDLTFACIGAVDALENCLDWVKASPERKAIVIASDLAKYDLESSGEYTQGAGSVAMLVTSSPSIIAFKNTIGISMEHVSDFFKPRRKIDNTYLKQKNISVQELTNTNKEKIEFYFEEPVFDGQYSNECYQKRIAEALNHFKAQKNINFLKDWQHMIFHLPYAFQGRRMMLDIWLEWIKDEDIFVDLEKEIGKSESGDYKDWRKAASKSTLYKRFVQNKIQDGEMASSFIGNMYTASIFMSLISLLYSAYDKKRSISGDNIGFLSYGSGSKSKILQAKIIPKWEKKISHLKILENINSRKIIDFETYEKLHNGALNNPIYNHNNIVLDSIDQRENKTGFRHYIKN